MNHQFVSFLLFIILIIAHIYTLLATGRIIPRGDLRSGICNGVRVSWVRVRCRGQSIRHRGYPDGNGKRYIRSGVGNGGVYKYEPLSEVT